MQKLQAIELTVVSLVSEGICQQALGWHITARTEANKLASHSYVSGKKMPWYKLHAIDTFEGKI